MRGNWFHPHLDMSVSVSMCVFIYFFLCQSYQIFGSHPSLPPPSPALYLFLSISFLFTVLCTFSRNFSSFAISFFFLSNADSSSSHSSSSSWCICTSMRAILFYAPSVFFSSSLASLILSFFHQSDFFPIYIYLAQTNNTRLIASWMFVGWLAGLLGSLIHFLSMCVLVARN